jgi:SagB-type dehydrogenase family enzyme
LNTELTATAFDALTGVVPSEEELDFTKLSRILGCGASVVRTHRRTDGQPNYLRAYASAGACYPVESYVVTGELIGLNAGVYHLDPLRRSLALLCGGDLRGALVTASGDDDAVQYAQALLILTGIPLRSTWRYGARGFRHLFWDAGTLAATLMALATAERIPARIVMGFADPWVRGLVGLGSADEVPLCILTLGRTRSTTPSRALPRPLKAVHRPTIMSSTAAAEVYRAHASMQLHDPDEVARWRSTGYQHSYRRDITDGGNPAVHSCPPETIEAVVRRRSSIKQFCSATPASADVLAAVVEQADSQLPLDIDLPSGRWVEPYLVLNRVAGLEPGAYRWREGFHLLETDDFSMMASYLCLGQAMGGAAAATAFLMADLAEVTALFGCRGYSVAQFAAGVSVGRAYLAASAHRWGTTALTFLDDAVETFFGSWAPPRACMLAIAIGPPARPHPAPERV